MHFHRNVLPALGLASLIVSVAGVGGARADFLDAIGRIFGGESSPPPAVQRYEQPPPLRYDYERFDRSLDVTVRPRAALPKRDTIQRVEKRVRERPAQVAQVEAPVLDPAKNPNWHLQDPTLRRGDIVVLKGEVLVFEGGGRLPRGREDFASLEESRLSPSEKAQLRQMAGVPAPSRTAQAQPAPVVLAGAAGRTN